MGFLMCVEISLPPKSGDETRLGTPSMVTEIETFLVPGASSRQDEMRRERAERNAAGAMKKIP